MIEDPRPQGQPEPLPSALPEQPARELAASPPDAAPAAPPSPDRHTTREGAVPSGVREEGERTAPIRLVNRIDSEEQSAPEVSALVEMYVESMKNLEEGEVLKGRILKVDEKDVLVDIGFKSEGIIPIDEFGEVESIKVGDVIDVFLERMEDEQGLVVLSKQRADFVKVWDRVKDAAEKGEVVEGRLVKKIKGGVVVDLFGVEAFLPGSQVALRQPQSIESLMNQTLQFKIIKLNKRRRNIVVSRRLVLEEEREKAKATILKELAVEQFREGYVKNITDFGAFIDLGGIDGLLHITDMSWGRVGHPSEMFNVGDEVRVVVLKFDRERERVSLGFKQLQDDPWETAIAKYTPQTRIRGKVVSLTDYGAFVEVEEGIEGLIHVSEMSWTKRVKHPSKILNVGDWVECVVLEIDSENRRLSLGLKQTEPNPWDMINTKYRVGDRITGTVRNITDFGAFVEVEEGIDGLVHISDLSWTKRVKHPSEILKKGDTVEAIILKIDSENQRLSLGMKQLQPNVAEDFFRSHGVGDILIGKVVRTADFGAFIELYEGIEGLVHVSEISKDRVEKPEEVLQPGQEVRVKIIKMDAVEKKIGLSIKAALDEPEDASYQSWSSRQQEGDGSATLGDLIDPGLFRRDSE